MALENEEARDYILESFVGEGSTSIVFGIAPLSNPTEQKWVLKFVKPDVRFEMGVLHHSLRIAEHLFPNHPLLMRPAERMTRLTEEMLTRIAAQGFPFSLDVYRDMVGRTIEVLASQFADRFAQGTLTPDFLEEIPGIRPTLDDNLALRIQSILDDDGIVETFRPFFEHCLPVLQKTIAEWKSRGEYFPIAQNRPFRLLGLHLEDFINWEELLEISESPLLTPPLSAEETADLGDAVSILHFQARNHEPSKDKNDDAGRYRESVTAAIAAARYQDTLAAKCGPGMEHIQGYARAWWARTLLFDGRRDEAMKMFEDALGVLTTEASLPDRHDVLNDIASLVAAADPKRAIACEEEAKAIRRELQID
jgi:hypothetical protein